MKKSQSNSISPWKGGNGSRLGVRTRKKHKKLDSINEDEFIRNREVNVELNEGDGREEVIENDSDLRRSSRVRKAPVILDSSPVNARKRQKVESLGTIVQKGSVEKSKGKDIVKVQSPSSSRKVKVQSPSSSRKVKGRSPSLSSSKEKVQDTPSSFNSKEELGVQRSGLRSSGRIGSPSLVYRRKQPRGKRKLVWDDEGDMKDEKDEPKDEKLCLESNESRVFKSSELESGRASVNGDDNCVEDGGMDIGVDGNPSMSGGVVGNEEILNGSPNQFVEKESENVLDIQPKEKSSQIDNVVENTQNHKPLDLIVVIEDVEKEKLAEEDNPVSAGLADNVGPVLMDEVVAKAKEQNPEGENNANLGNCDVSVSGTLRSRVKKGRRCGLCGGGTDGKPPKIMANDSAASDDDGYSGSSASEECSYDPWDGFGDEPGWLGRLLGPVNDRYGIVGTWVHQHCAVWSPEVYFAGLGCLKNIKAALFRGRSLKCTRCGRPGATLGCRVDRCPRTYHLPCARASGCIFDHRKFLIACADHRYLFQPHGVQYAQRIKKLKAKKMKMEIRKHSNEASKKDLEAEEKWLENCGEDEEFLRRETKRLQRDLLRIAPVYIGGPNSGDENPFEGWESVAGLNDVIQSMKEVVILPLLYPKFFENMGITPPRGVLLHGYPGTGKTLIVRALIGSCARGDKRIAYFARKGADCLGKYVGDAERQLRLLFQVAEKSQPSIIFFDEIDGLAPVRTRQQDQTHSSVVSTLLALMDGLKSRGSVIVIGATNRPDSIDPALRRPGRFDREIYFPLPSMKDRASILALHTKKWPKPVSGNLLDWVASKTVGFAGADLQALCAQSAVIALKRNCSWQKILSFAEINTESGKRPPLPSFVVEERDWLEALSRAPPPCSRREAGMAANEVFGSPLHINLVPFLLKPLLSLIISLNLDNRLWLPNRLVNVGASIKEIVLSFMEKKGIKSDNWWCHVQDMVQCEDFTKEITKNLVLIGIIDGDTSLTGSNLPNDTSFGDNGFHSRNLNCTFGSLRNLRNSPSPKSGYRILISGDPRSGQKHLASCLLHCFVGGIEMQKIDLATISQEGHGDMELGISHILMKCSSVKLCALFMPRIDLWAIQSYSSVEEDVETIEVTESQGEIRRASQTWRSFVEQLEYICVSSSLIILATSELPNSSLPRELCQFFGSEHPNSEGSIFPKCATNRFSVDVEKGFDHDKFLHLSSSNLSRDLIQQFLQLVHATNHSYSDSKITNNAHDGKKRPILSDKDNEKPIEEEPRAKPELSLEKLPIQSGSKSGKGKSSLVLAITSLGYQILKYPHFAELCWVTSKLNEGPSTHINGPWKGWPFNTCIVCPSKSNVKEGIPNNASNSKGKDQFTLVRGLIAVGLNAYRGVYTSAIEVSLDVRKVLELLIGMIASRIQAGKDRYQYFRILSQVAYLEDMVNSWSHSLRSLESDNQTSNMNFKLNDRRSLETLQPPVDNTKQVGELNDEHPIPTLLSTQGDNPEQVQESNVDHPELEEGQEQDARRSHTIDPNTTTIDVECANVVETENFDEGSSQNPLSKEKSSPMKAGNLVSDIDMKDSVIDQSNSISEGSIRESNQDSPEKSGPHLSRELGTESLIENEISKSKSGLICCYSCCLGCIYTLEHLVKKRIIRELELLPSNCTIEEVQDLISTLSSRMCSFIRNMRLTQGCENGGLKSGKLETLENGCLCKDSDYKQALLEECVCHSGKDFCGSDNTSLNQTESNLTFTFRDGVFVSATTSGESSSHCKYDTFCLCSLIVGMKQNID